MVQVQLRTTSFLPLGAASLAVRRAPFNNIKYVFVYGTLRKGLWNYQQTIPSGLKVEEDARIHGLLFKAGKFPVVVVAEDVAGLGRPDSSEAGFVFGELIRLPSKKKDREALIARLDTFEGVDPYAEDDGFYRRTTVSVYRIDGSVASAWAYIAPRSRYAEIAKEGELFPHGDFLRTGSALPERAAVSSTMEKDRQQVLAGYFETGRAMPSPVLDGPIGPIVQPLIEKEAVDAARTTLWNALDHGSWNKDLPDLIIQWATLYFDDPVFVANYRNWNDWLIGGISLIERAASRISFTRKQVGKLLTLLEPITLLEHDEVSVGDRIAVLKTIGSLVAHQPLAEAAVASFIEKTLPLLKKHLTSPGFQYVAVVDLFAELVRKKSAGPLLVKIGEAFIFGLRSLPKNSLQYKPVLAALRKTAENWSPASRAAILETLKALLLTQRDSNLKQEIASTILVYSGAEMLMEAAPHMLEKGRAAFLGLAEELQSHGKGEELFFPTALAGNNPDIREAALIALHAAGEEAVKFATDELGIFQRAAPLVFLEGVLWASHGKKFSETKARLRTMVDAHRAMAYEIKRQGLDPFFLRKGFEIEWWPRDFAKLPEDLTLFNITSTLRALRLYTSNDGFGEYASFPSQRIELQHHLFSLIQRLGLFPPTLATSLHLNLGLPFELTYYQVGVSADGISPPPETQEHPELYAALSLVWLPIGVISMSDARWNNMLRPGEESPARAIQYPFRFHGENVLGGDKSRLELRPFEVSETDPFASFSSLLRFSSHLTVALFWKELHQMRGTKKNLSQFKALGWLWAKYAHEMHAVLADSGLMPPNYFEQSRKAELEQTVFHERVKHLRHRHPEKVQYIRERVELVVKEIDAIIGIPLNTSLPLPPPLFHDPNTYLI